jgi:ubiquinone/menaquinone biosynthesis C-methylase UbiE
LFWLFLKNYTDLFSSKKLRLLHIAPEDIFETKLKQISNIEYITGDISNPNIMYKFDITRIPFKDNSFDAIYCSHVLEHVPDDKKAISEFYRGV